MMMIQSQIDNLTQVFSEFLEFTHKKAKFMEHLESITKRSAEKKEKVVELV